MPPGASTRKAAGEAVPALAASGRVLAAISCVLLIVMAGAVLARAREGPLRRLPARVVTVLAWVAMVYAAVAVVLNIITRSTAERTLWAPVSIVLPILTVKNIYRALNAVHNLSGLRASMISPTQADRHDQVLGAAGYRL